MIDISNVNYDMIFRRYDIFVETKENPEDIAERLLPKDTVLRKVAEDVVYMKYKDVEADVKAALGKFSPEELVEKGLLKGMDVVSELYGRGIYYLPHVMVAADTFDKGIKTAEKAMKGERALKGNVVMMVAEGDPHDIGKNIAAVMLRSHGYGVVDMGRDVPVDDVVKQVEESKPDLVTGTALMTTTMSAFPKVAERLIEKGIEIPFICAGGAVNRSFVESYPLGVYAAKAAEGPGLADRAVEGWDWKKLRSKWDDIVSGKNGGGKTDEGGLRAKPEKAAPKGIDYSLRSEAHPQEAIKAMDVDSKNVKDDREYIFARAKPAGPMAIPEKSEKMEMIPVEETGPVDYSTESGEAHSGLKTTVLSEESSAVYERHVQALVYDNSDKDHPKKLKQVFQAGIENLLRIWIGKLEEGTIAASTKIDLSVLPDMPSWDLDVYFWEINHVPKRQNGKLTVFKDQLPGQTMSKCEFSFVPRADQPDFKGNVAVLYQNNILQMLFLKGKVLSDIAMADEDDQIRFESVDVRGLKDIAGLQKFDLALFSETDPSNGPGLMSFGNQASMRKIEGLQTSIQQIIATLKEAGIPGPDDTLEARKDALGILARQGSEIYTSIQEQIGTGDEALLNLRDAKRLQLVSAVRDVFPLELVYVYPAPNTKAKLCPNSEQAILNGKCSSCEGLNLEGAAETICPLGFLGMRCVIERHAINSTHMNELKGIDYKIYDRPIGSAKKIDPFKSSLFAISNKITTDGRERLTKTLQTLFPGKLEFAQDWDEWKTKIKLSPTILILIPHNQDSKGGHSLEIGETFLENACITETFVHVSPQVWPLVLLIGCLTSLPDTPYQGFAAAFSKAGAAVTVTTLSPIHESRAVPIAEILIKQFKESAGLGQSFGDALLHARRVAMAAGYAEVLTLVADGDADWTLTKGG